MPKKYDLMWICLSFLLTKVTQIICNESHQDSHNCETNLTKSQVQMNPSHSIIQFLLLSYQNTLRKDVIEETLQN